MNEQLILVENSGEDFTCKFDGKYYSFKKGNKVPMSIDAARHIFGFGLDNKSEVFARHGWMLKSTDYDEAMKRLDTFKFSMGTMKVVPDTPELEVQEQEQPYHVPESDTEVPKGQSSAPLQSDAEGEDEVTDGAKSKPSASTYDEIPSIADVGVKNKPGMMTDGIFTG